MKQILTSLLVAYTLTNGQTPPGTTSAPVSSAPATTGGAAAVTSSAPVLVSLASTQAPGTGTQAPGTLSTAAAFSTTAAPAYVAPGTSTPVVIPPPPPAPGTNGAPVTIITDPAVNPPAPVVTPAPVTAAPTTAAPTYNPYCPMPAELSSQHGVTSGTPMSSNQGCISPFERAVAFNGKLQCSTYSCCQCAEIQCGDPFGLACDELVISDSGAVGNQNINVLGDMTSAFGGNSFAGIGGAMNNGAQIRCSGLESCKAAKINGKYVGQMDCSGDMGCAGANVRLEDPGHDFQFQCNGMMSCMNMNLEIVITPNSQTTELNTIEFNGQQAAQGMTITITNQAYHPVLLQNLECMNPTACPNLRINIVGNVFIENCDLQHMNIQTAGPSLLAACQAGGGGNMPYMGVPYNPQPVAPAPPQWQQPAAPAPPQYQQPAAPAPPQYQQPAAPAPPAQQQPVAPAPAQQPPAQQPFNPMQYRFCNPMSPDYDLQDCYLYGGGMQGMQQGGGAGMNTQNPYCNPMSPIYDIQDCMQYGAMYGQQQQYNPYGQQQQPQYNPYAQQQYNQYPQYNPWI